MNMINNFFIVAIGGALGAVLRFTLIDVFNNNNFAYGTLLANSIGSLLAGIFFVLITKLDLSITYKYLLIIGFCGSLTTLSAISMDSINLFSQNYYFAAITNLLSNVVLSLIMVVFGIYLAKIS